MTKLDPATVSRLALLKHQTALAARVDKGQLAKMPEGSVSERAKYLRSRIETAAIVVADLDRILAESREAAS
jgi:hypothetical protein